MSATYLVYCLRSVRHPSRTYVGCTNNFARRLRQHNRELRGGARYMGQWGPWRVLFRAGGSLTRRQALQLEWDLKHRRRGPGGIVGRIASLERLLWEQRRCPVEALPVRAHVTRAQWERALAPFKERHSMREESVREFLSVKGLE